MIAQRRKIKKPPTLNLIPILDAIFIFIFFLLMSAQFIDVYEIGSDAPITTTTDKISKDKKPLNLIIELKNKTIIVKTGLESIIYKQIPLSNLDDYNNTLIELKQRYPKETSAILKPSQTFSYEKIVKVIDSTREISKQNVYITAVDIKNKPYQSKTLFDKIIFETQD